MKKVFSLIAILFITLSLYAVVATSEPIPYTQPDGSVINISLSGDEHFSYRTTLDGYFIAKNADGAYCYVNYMADGTYAFTPIVAHDPNNRQTTEKIFVSSLSRELPCVETVSARRRIAQQANLSSTYPRIGSPRSIVILVNYTDVKFKYKREDFERLCNESGYSENRNNGSCRDFFIAQSDSLFQPIFDLYGPYELEHNQEYYGGNQGGDHSQRAADMIVEACSKAMNAGVDFSLYDFDNDGVIDNVFVFYAGHGEADSQEENAVWPHRSAITSSHTYGGKILRDYACSSELRGGGGMATIGTFCHEFGHVLGLPDYYDTRDDAAQTVGSWDIMCSGSYNGPNGFSGATPPSYSAHSRWWLGWRNNIVQLSTPGQYVLSPLEQSGTQAYLIANGNHSLSPRTDSEFFLLENREHVGWDEPSEAIPGTGMLVWHINYNAGKWANNEPNSGGALNYFILSPSGRDRTGGDRADTYPGSYNRTEFNPTLKNGTNLGQPVFDIQMVDKDVMFIYKSGSENNFTIFPSQLQQFNSGYDPEKNIFTSVDVQSIIIDGESLDPAVPVSLSSSDGCLLLAVDSGKWRTALQLYADTDSVLNQRIYIGFRPNRMYCVNDVFSAVLNINYGNNRQVLPVTGIAPRAVKVVTPQNVVLDQATPYTAALKWKKVDDASKYYLTLYQMHDGESSIVQSFEGFDNADSILLAGWTTNFTSLSTLYKADGRRSLYFQNDGDYALSQLYLQPITKLSFFRQAYNVSNVDSVGLFLLEAYNGIEWDTIATIPLYAAEKATDQYTFDYDKGYVQFKITFFATEKSKGAVIDAFTAVCGKQIDYIYSNSDLVVDQQEGKTVSHTIGNLLPDAEYYFQVQASDEGQGGCSTTITSPSEPLLFRTMEGKNGEKDLTYSVDSIGVDMVLRMIYIPQVEDGGTLFFYDAFGHLIVSVEVLAGQNGVPFPNANFIKGQWYLVQFAPQDKLKRKNRRTKMLY